MYFTLKSAASGLPLCVAQPQWLSTVKHLQLDVHSQVVVNVTSAQGQEANLTLSLAGISGPALFVVVRNTKYRGIFSNNMLHLIPGEATVVTFVAKEVMNQGQVQIIESAEDFGQHLTVDYLNQMWS